MISQAKREAQSRYDRANTQGVLLKLNKKTDADILAKLEESENKQGYIKSLIRKDLLGNGDVLSIDAIRILLLPLAKRFEIKKITLFGSYARGEATKDSDVDLLIEGGRIKRMSEYMELLEQVEKCLGKKTDLLMASALKKDNSRSGKRLKEHIKKDKVVLYESA